MVLETNAETALSLFELSASSFERSVKKWPTEPEKIQSEKQEDSFFTESIQVTETEMDCDEGEIEI